jgi:hypothetical protein
VDASLSFSAIVALASAKAFTCDFRRICRQQAQQNGSQKSCQHDEFKGHDRLLVCI